MKDAPDSQAPTGRADKLFATEREMATDFAFDANTAAVFDDMLARSVPFYGEIQRMTVELGADFVEEGTSVYDLGCSTGSTMLDLGKVLSGKENIHFVGVDYSKPMLAKARAKLTAAGFEHEVEFRHGDLNDELSVTNASLVLMVLTLQFVRPLARDRLLSTLCSGLAPNGCLILVEKVLGEHSLYNRLFIKHYYELKRRQGYSDLEIAQKREALENVLVPYRLKENENLLLRNGFTQVDVFFKWYNFCGIIAC
ncbi:MAG TPA: carboxy-S-adenosyl-L-methionine synthase CmoA [Planctomycetota bacterium]|nr:carboxy-S-adenosyl-L-methionine synthase CmoA [Planctomycetota bacterium]